MDKVDAEIITQLECDIDTCPCKIVRRAGTWMQQSPELASIIRSFCCIKGFGQEVGVSHLQRLATLEQEQGAHNALVLMYLAVETAKQQLCLERDSKLAAVGRRTAHKRRVRDIPVQSPTIHRGTHMSVAQHC